MSKLAGNNKALPKLPWNFEKVCTRQVIDWMSVPLPHQIMVNDNPQGDVTVR